MAPARFPCSVSVTRKPVSPTAFDLLDLDLVESCQGREFGLQSLDKASRRRRRPLDLRGGAVGVVADLADELELGGDAVNGGTKSDSLDGPAAPHPETVHELLFGFESAGDEVTPEIDALAGRR